MTEEIHDKASQQVPPVTRLVMFRHGVAYVERSGPADGPFEMTFRRRASAKPSIERQRIWRAGAGPNPDLVIHFVNDSDIVLEEGPVVVYDGGSYAGEAMLPYSARGAEIKLAFAKDLAVRCSENVIVEQHRVGITLDKNGVLEEQRREMRHTLRAESDHDKAITVIFEVRRQHGHTLAEVRTNANKQLAQLTKS